MELYCSRELSTLLRRKTSRPSELQRNQYVDIDILLR